MPQGAPRERTQCSSCSQTHLQVGLQLLDLRAQVLRSCLAAPLLLRQL